MAEDSRPGNEDLDRAIDQLRVLQHEAQHAPVRELAYDVAAMLNDLAHTLNGFNELVAAQPCSCGCTQEAARMAALDAARLAVHIGVYTLAVSQRSPGGFHIGLNSASVDLN
jgi:hypothetical protein